MGKPLTRYVVYHLINYVKITTFVNKSTQSLFHIAMQQNSRVEFSSIEEHRKRTLQFGIAIENQNQNWCIILKLPSSTEIVCQIEITRMVMELTVSQLTYDFHFPYYDVSTHKIKIKEENKISRREKKESISLYLQKYIIHIYHLFPILSTQYSVHAFTLSSFNIVVSCTETP